ncbi:hypothetical protein bsdcttw_09490 [Anaerocolumna chitinilytica]|uniref:Uncharacterized protein n=1 Tax=Anaerocolumna chitinilytica TaxID=1727145 RepID=A0A7I8DHB9_9FIRM|nr:hypothetical protein bsdcttw_09490 [Anaerocolumna chitinilytica]
MQQPLHLKPLKAGGKNDTVQKEFSKIKGAEVSALHDYTLYDIYVYFQLLAVTGMDYGFSELQTC